MQMNLADVMDRLFTRPSRAAQAELCKLTDDQLRERLLVTREAAKVMAAGECGSVEELIRRAANEIILSSAVRGYIRHKTGVALHPAAAEPRTLMSLAQKLMDSGECTSIESLLDRLAMELLAMYSERATS
jgi:hypothetical protein